MVIQNANGLVHHLFLIEKLTKEILSKRPDLSDEEAFNLAKSALEILEKAA